jgi:hypothetical protein
MKRLVAFATTLGTVAVFGAGLISPSAAYADTQLPMPGIPTATQITPTSIAFTWTASAGPVSSYTIQAAEGLGAYHTVATTSATAYTDSGLSPDTVYYHRVIANPVPGSGFTASDPSFALYAVTNPASDTIAPTKPGTPVATPTTPTTAAVTTTGSTDNDSVAGYWVQRQVSGAWVDWVMSSYGAFSLQQLTGSTTYTVVVVAFDRTGNRSVRSDPVTFTTPPYAAAPSCKVQRQVIAPTAYILTATVENMTQATVVTSWTTTFTMPAAQTAINTISSTLSHNGDVATLRPAANTAQISPGTTVMVGFYGSRPADSPLPSGFTFSSPATGPIACPVTDRTG